MDEIDEFLLEIKKEKYSDDYLGDLQLKVKKLVDDNNYDEYLCEYALEVAHQLIEGKRDIPIHPEPTITEYGTCVSANKLLDEKIYSKKRKICYQIGELLPKCQTHGIKGKCGMFIGCKDERYGDGYCGCDGYVPNNFGSFHINNDYDDLESYSLMPWTLKVGVRFMIKGEMQNHSLSEKFKLYGPMTNKQKTQKRKQLIQKYLIKDCAGIVANFLSYDIF